MAKYLDMPGLTFFYNQIKNKFASKSDIGTPLKASTKQMMTDPNKIYIYTGVTDSDPGMKNGYWYYKDGNTWVEGGAYNAQVVETDKTLEDEDTPADAKATGDKIGELNDVLYLSTGNKKIPVSGTGGYISLSGSTANIVSPVTNASSEYAVVACEEGDIFTITTAGGVNGRAYGFVSSNGNVLDVAGASVSVTEKVVTAPPNSAYLVINAHQTTIDAYYGVLVKDELKNLSRSFRSIFNGKKISIIGDSIDTFNQVGYKIDGYRMYYPSLGVTDVNQTWWKQVIDNSGSKLEVNASWSGSRVTDTHSDSSYPDFYDRVSVIGSPDVIFVTLGTNDSSNNVALGDYDFTSDYSELSESTFRTAYIKGIKALKDTYTNAEIICITQKMQDAYKESIATIASELSCIYIDASDYEGSSGVHPGQKGMLQIASLVLYPTDTTLNQKHIAADSEKVGKEFGDFKNTIRTNQYVLLPDILSWRQGTISATTGDYQANDARVNSSRFIGISDITVDYAECALICYDSNVSILGSMNKFSQSFTAEQIKSMYPTAAYCRVILRYPDGSDITPEDVENVGLKIYSPTTFYDRFLNYKTGGEFLNKEITVGGFNNSGINKSASNRLRSVGYVKVKPNTIYTLKASSNVPGKQVVPGASLYSVNDYSTSRIRGSGFGYNGECSFITTGNTKYIRFLFAFDDDSDMTVDSISSIVLTELDISFENYFVDSAFMKHKVIPVYLGNLSALQSFFKYGDYYYSTQGSKLFKQDLNLNAVSEKSLNLGHGNAMHLGTDGNAFASGWDDQNVYEIDIANEEIIRTINLPTTGYTTCAVDDINMIMYIFQRDERTTPPDNWNFIAYDYYNENVLLTKTTRPFGAIQGVDFVNGKIFALSGMGNVTNPNYFSVYNTQGDIIGEYILNQFADSEPEGVCVDRTDGSVYMSFSNKNLYRLYCI